MFEKYTLDSQKILTLAESLAFSYSDSEVTELHLFVAFLKSNETDLAQVLRANGTKVLPFETMLKNSRKNDMAADSPFYLEYTEELLAVMAESEKLSKEKREKKVSPLSLSLALIRHTSPTTTKIFSLLKVTRETVSEALEKCFRKSSELDSIIDLHRLGVKPIDPLVGRRDEIDELVKALRRRNKANAVLVGEPGVGKSHIVEHLAKMIEEGKIPELADRKIYELDIASTVSGTKYRGEFEEKIKKILKKVIDDGHTILFIDEIHNIVKAGGAEGAIDCANILKPYLTRGEISVIGATTLDEYEKVFSEDKALKRRFQVIKIRQNNHEETKDILLTLLPLYRNYYKVNIPTEAVDCILDLTDRYAPNESYPDKAIDILDNACLEADENLTRSDIIKTVERIYKVKVDFKPKAQSVMTRIRQEIRGQEHAMNRLERDLKILDNSLYDGTRPLGIYMFIGPSGVGKTETAKSLARHYFNSELSFFKLDMADFRDPSSLSKLSGSAPGYVGYKDLPPLVKQLKTFPHSLILLDEIEKAATGVLDFFLNVFDEGYFVDGTGQKINTGNAFFVLTSNYSFDSEHLFSKRMNSGDVARDERQIKKVLEEKFRYEFLARLDDIILFDPLSEEAKRGIVSDCLKKYKDVNEQQALEIAEEILINADKSEIERYGARALRKLTKEKIMDKLSEKKLGSF